MDRWDRGAHLVRQRAPPRGRCWRRCVGATIHATRGRFEVDGSLAARLSSHGAGHGVYGEASTTFTLGERTALLISGGRYPTDPVSGSVAGRYLSAGLRLRTPLLRPRPIRDRS